MSHTQDFIIYLTEIASGNKEFAHQYHHRKMKSNFKFSSFIEAFEKYHWGIKKEFHYLLPPLSNDFSSYEANAIVLTHLSKQIKSAYEEKNNSSLFDASEAILRWGGVLNKGNKAWLKENRSDLLNLYLGAQTAFENRDFGSVPRSNAGQTKIYSLLFDHFVIYDSRVAASLGLFVMKYCQDRGLVELPDELHVRWMPAKEGEKCEEPKLRTATPNWVTSSDKLHFCGVYNDHLHHAESNDKANYILAQVVDRIAQDSPFHGDMRKLEAALFMIGYDLKGHEWLSTKK